MPLLSNSTRTFMSSTALATTLLALTSACPANAQRTLIGNLMCTAAPSQAGERKIECRLHSSDGQSAKYQGTIQRLGKVPRANEQLVFNWSVLGSTSKIDVGSLEGRYLQTPGKAGSAFPANLVGGKDNAIVMQPLDDFGGAFAVLELELSATRV